MKNMCSKYVKQMWAMNQARVVVWMFLNIWLKIIIFCKNNLKTESVSLPLSFVFHCKSKYLLLANQHFPEFAKIIY